MEFLKTIYEEMTLGNFSLAILIVGGLQLFFQIVTFVILIVDRRIKRTMFGKKKVHQIKEDSWLPNVSRSLCLNDIAEWQQSAEPKYLDKLRIAKKLITEAELEFGKKVGNMELVNMMIDMENSITYILANSKESTDVE